MEWTEITLGEHIEVLTDYHANGAYEKLKANVELKSEKDFAVMIRTLNFERGDFEKELIYINEKEYNFLAKSKVYPGDILMNKIADAGSVYCMPDLNCPVSLAMNLFLIRLKPSLNQKFMYYMMKFYEPYIKLYANGAATLTITKDSVRKLKFNVPDIDIQDKIVALVSAYDDLIENNLKRIKLLEEMAQITYEEWFVRMKFPGHETAIFDEETGLPEGWENRLMENACEVSGGGTPSKEKDEYWLDGDITWFSPTDLSKAGTYCLLDSSQKITAEGLKKSSAKLLQPNSFMMTSRATIGLFALIDKPFSTNQGFINVTPFEDFHKYYLFFNLKSRVSELYNHASGATFPEISKSKFKKLKLNWPSEEMFKEFHNYVSPVIRTMMDLTKQNELLKEARDILLPRLMTGMIDIEQVELPDAMLNRLEQQEDEMAAAV